MTLKIVGAILIIITSGIVGMTMCSAYLRQCYQLEDMLRTFHFMKCELQYRLTPLSTQFSECATLTRGAVSRFFHTLSIELGAQILPDAQCCLAAAITKNKDLCKKTVDILNYFGSTLGCFDLNGQIAGIEEATSRCSDELERIKKDKPNRVRNYQTLSLCAGAALVIVLI